MNICGIELKGQELYAAVVSKEKKEWNFIETSFSKIQLKNSSSAKEVRTLKKKLDAFFTEQNIQKIIVKKRMEKGMYAASTTSFKIEGLIQLYESADIELITAQKIASLIKKADIQYPENLKKYQKVAFDTAYAYIHSK